MTVSADVDVDVAVIGGGPAGSTVATRLAQLGHRVLMLDRGGRRQSHRWETLAGAVLDLLELPGSAAPVRHVGFPSVAMIDSAWDGPLARRALPAGSLLVDRRRFDAVLRRHAAASGVTVVCPAVVDSSVRHGDGWRVLVHGSGAVVGARFLVDASGRPAARRGSVTGAPATLGLTGRWCGDVPYRPMVVTVDDGWVWCAPADDAGDTPSCEVTAFVDTEQLRSLDGATLADRYRTMVRTSGVLGRSARPIGRVRAQNASALVADEVATDRGLRVGDAGLALDPLSSSGVLRATQSALSAAIVVHTVLSRPADAGLALDHHRRALADAYVHHRAWTAEAYAAVSAVRPTPYWLARGAHAGGTESAPDPVQPVAMPASDQMVRRSPSVRFVETTQVLADRIALAPAIEHPGFDGAIAFLGDTAVVPLLRDLDVDVPLGEVVARWSRTLSLQTAEQIAGWLVRRGVIERAEVA